MLLFAHSSGSRWRLIEIPDDNSVGKALWKHPRSINTSEDMREGGREGDRNREGQRYRDKDRVRERERHRDTDRKERHTSRHTQRVRTTSGDVSQSIPSGFCPSRYRDMKPLAQCLAPSEGSKCPRSLHKQNPESVGRPLLPAGPQPLPQFLPPSWRQPVWATTLLGALLLPGLLLGDLCPFTGSTVMSESGASTRS